MPAQPLHIAHVIYALKTGGLENGLVNLINRLPEDQFRHTIICMTEFDDFAARITRPGVAIHALSKKDGHDLSVFVKLYRLFRELKPDIVHTRNLATIEVQIPAWLAGVPGRIHGEHGRDSVDPDGLVKKYQWLRKFCSPVVQRFVALSKDLEDYLIHRVKIPTAKVTRICNGVDTKKFQPDHGKGGAKSHPFADTDLIIGYVGRMNAVKDPLNLARAFVLLHQQGPDRPVRLVMLGDGPERKRVLDYLAQHDCSELAWLPGQTESVAEQMRSFDVYVLPSLAEGISNTLLETMATGLPAVVTRVGGNEELALDKETALLVERDDSVALANALNAYLTDPEIRKRHGSAARRRVEESFSLQRMVEQYSVMYQQLSARPNDVVSRGIRT